VSNLNPNTRYKIVVLAENGVSEFGDENNNSAEIDVATDPAGWFFAVFNIISGLFL
jgi:hypothetical protein